MAGQTPRTADAVVVGGGIVGASAFCQLGSLGLPHVVLCERRRPGAGASGASGAFIQYHFCHDPAETRLTQASLPYFALWDELVGAGSCGFVPCGYLRLEPEERAAVLRDRVAMLRAEGVDSRVIAPDDVARLAPYLRREDVAVAAWEPASGYADAERTVDGLLEAGRRHGGELCAETTVTGVRVRGGRVVGVDTSGGPIDTPRVVLAAGAWSGALLRHLGLDLPLTPALTQWMGVACALPPDMVTVGDGATQSYFRAHDGIALVGLGGQMRRPLVDLEAEETPIPDALGRQAREALAARLAGAADGRAAGGRTGPVTLTPDDRPIIDRHPAIEGLYFFAGDCGSSFKTGPAIGRALAEWSVLGRPELVDVSAFSAGRFAGEPITSHSGMEQP